MYLTRGPGDLKRSLTFQQRDKQIKELKRERIGALVWKTDDVSHRSLLEIKQRRSPTDDKVRERFCGYTDTSREDIRDKAQYHVFLKEE